MTPYEWNFRVKNDDKKTWFNKGLDQDLRYWSSYSHSNIDDSNLEYHNHNLTYNINLNWLKVKSNIKISSLEDIYEQPRNRYSVTLKNENIKLELGDFFPYFNDYILNGSRVRGFNLNSKYKWLSVNFIKGELQRATQGDPYDNSIYISNVDTTNNVLTISRDNYAFKRELSALKIGISFGEKVLWNFNLFKAKDNINSVYSSIPDAQLEIDTEYIEDPNNSYLVNTINDSTYIMSYKDFVLSYI